MVAFHYGLYDLFTDFGRIYGFEGSDTVGDGISFYSDAEMAVPVGDEIMPLSGGGMMSFSGSSSMATQAAGGIVISPTGTHADQVNLFHNKIVGNENKARLIASFSCSEMWNDIEWKNSCTQKHLTMTTKKEDSNLYINEATIKANGECNLSVTARLLDLF
ncbi:MAG: hypothetical protein FWE97_04840 [Dehalococcoidia bacterium]|nr:hypothetical protein [Dehalococcoidia bacterium]